MRGRHEIIKKAKEEAAERERERAQFKRARSMRAKGRGLGVSALMSAGFSAVTGRAAQHSLDDSEGGGRRRSSLDDKRKSRMSRSVSQSATHELQARVLSYPLPHPSTCPSDATTALGIDFPI